MASSLPNPLAREQNLTPPSGDRTTARRLDVPAPLRLWHLASLDAPTVAVVWSTCFASVAGVRADGWNVLLLALVTWTIYVGDRLLDASRLRGGDVSQLRQRHLFHWRYRRILLPVAFTTAVIAAGIFFVRLPVVSRERDSVLAAAALAYFSGVHVRPLPPAVTSRITKEFLVGTFFVAGCALPMLTRLRLVDPEWNSLAPLLAMLIFFAALGWLNCYAIDCWECGCTRAVFARGLGLTITGLTLTVVLAPGHAGSAAMVGAGSLSALLLTILDRNRARLTPLALRLAADLVLLTPGVLLLG